MASTLEELFADVPVIIPGKVSPKHYPDNLTRGRYSEKDDDLVLFYNDDAKHGIYIHQAGGFHVIVHPETHEVVGMYIEGWVKDYVERIPVLKQLWTEVRARGEPQFSPLAPELGDLLTTLGTVSYH